MTETLYTATSEYVEEIKALPVKRQVSVSGILKKLDVSRSGYHAWKKRVPSDTSVRRAVLKEKIQKVYEDSHQTTVLLKLLRNCGNPGSAFLKKLWEIICVKWESKPSG